MKWNRKLGTNKDVVLTLPFVFLMGTSAAFGEKLTINKCCPKGQEFNSTLMCVNATGDLKDNKINNTTDAEGKMSPKPRENSSKIYFPDSAVGDEIYPWFPFASLTSSANLEPIADREAIKKIIDKADLKFGTRPACKAEDEVFGCFGRDGRGQFRLIFYPDGDVKFYASEKSSYHEGRFQVESRDCGFSKGNNSEGEEGGDLPAASLFKSTELRTFPLDDVCMDKGPGEIIFLVFCPCNTVRCVQKCCKDSEIFDQVRGKCIPHLGRSHLRNSNFTTNYYLLPRRDPWTCKKFDLLKTPPAANLGPNQGCGDPKSLDSRNEFHILSDGSLKAIKYKSKIPARSYCGDHVMYNSTVFSENNLLICLEDEGPFPKFHIYEVFFVIGGIAFLVTVSISLYLPKLRTSVYSKVIICHNVTLMCAYFMWGPTYLFQFVTHNLCAVFGLAIQYTFLGSLFWMNVMCLDIFQEIRRFKSPVLTTNENQRFLSYVIYACGGPIIITSMTAVMEFAPPLPSQYIRPDIRCYNCGFDPDSLALLVYFYGPALVIIFLSLCFYILTVIQLRKAQKETTVLDGKCTYHVCLIRSKKKLIIFGKLFFLVSPTWIIEIVCWVFGKEDFYWFISSLANILRAMFIFFVFVGKKRIFRFFVKKLKKPRNVSQVGKSESEATAELAEIKRRERILMKQITQTFRKSDELPD